MGEVVAEPSVCGNKRVAFALVYTFLRVNGILLTANADATYAFVHDFYESGRFNFAQLEPWLRAHTAADSS